MIKITLPGEPISKDRPRFSRFGTYDPQKKEKNSSKWQIIEHLKKYPNLPFASCPIEIEMNFFFPIPKGQENLFQWGLLFHTCKPDYDNCEKFVLDCLSGIVYSDDRQVIISKSKKEYSSNPRTEIYIMPKKPEVDDQVKEILSIISPSSLVEKITELSFISDWLNKNEHFSTPDYEEIAFLVLEFAEKHADNLKKINKKFPGLAKVLKERMSQK